MGAMDQPMGMEPGGQTMAGPEEATPSKGARDPWTLLRLLIVAAAVLNIVSPGIVERGVAVYAEAFFLVLLLPAVVALGLILWKGRPWTYLTSGILASLFPLFVLIEFEGYKSLQDPALANEFRGSILNLAALLLALPAGIAAFAWGRKGKALAPLGPGWRTGFGLYAIGLAFFVLGGIVFGGFAASQAAGSAGGGYDFEPETSVALAIEEFAFVPEEITIASGVITEIVVENRDAAFHTFTYASNGTTYNHDLPGQTTVAFLVRIDAPATIMFWCVPHSAGASDDGSGMVGSLVAT